MRSYYEELWDERPPAGPPEDFDARRGFLLEHVEPGRRVVDVGCGDGAFAAALAEHGATPVGVDVAEAAVRRAAERHPGLEFLAVPEEGPLPFDDASFDTAWAGEVIEHVADTAPWLSEVRRVLKPGGRLLLSTPYHGRAKALLVAVRGFEEHFDPRGEHLRFYTRRSLRALLEDFGFEALELSALGGPPLLRRTLLAAGVRAR